MIRRPPRSTPLSLHDALPIWKREEEAVAAILGNGFVRRAVESVSYGGTQNGPRFSDRPRRSEEHTSELQSHSDLVCRLLLEIKKAHALTPVTHCSRILPSPYK